MSIKSLSWRLTEAQIEGMNIDQALGIIIVEWPKCKGSIVLHVVVVLHVGDFGGLLKASIEPSTKSLPKTFSKVLKRGTLRA